MKKIIPAWGKEVKKALIDKDMSVADLATQLDLSKSHVNNVINGTFNYPDIQQRICDYLGVAASK